MADPRLPVPDDPARPNRRAPVTKRNPSNPRTAILGSVSRSPRPELPRGASAHRGCAAFPLDLGNGLDAVNNPERRETQAFNRKENCSPDNGFGAPGGRKAWLRAADLAPARDCTSSCHRAWSATRGSSGPVCARSPPGGTGEEQRIQEPDIEAVRPRERVLHTSPGQPGKPHVKRQPSTTI